MKNLIIDTDPGIDDAVAMMFAAGSGCLDLKAVTTVSGNLPADRCSVNARQVLELIGLTHVPVARGRQTPLTRPYPIPRFSHGEDGLGEMALPPPGMPEDSRAAPELILDTVNAHASDITIVAIGPLTNIALAVTLDPDLPRKVSRLIILGGAYGFTPASSARASGGNPVSELNIYVDPEAAKIVFEAGFSMTAIGLDIVSHEALELTAAHRARLAGASTPGARYLRHAVEFVERRGFRAYCALIDSLAIAVAIDPGVIATEAVHVGIETEGRLTLGQTVVDRREFSRWTHLPLIEAATSLDSRRFFDLLLDSLT